MLPNRATHLIFRVNNKKRPQPYSSCHGKRPIYGSSRTHLPKLPQETSNRWFFKNTPTHPQKRSALAAKKKNVDTIFFILVRGDSRVLKYTSNTRFKKAYLTLEVWKKFVRTSVQPLCIWAVNHTKRTQSTITLPKLC